MICKPSQLSIVFTTSNGLISRLIRLVTKSECSHAAIGTEIHGVDVLIHADFGGVQVTPLSKFLRRNTVVCAYAAPNETLLALSRAVERIGEAYDYVGLLGFVVVMIGRRLGRRMKNPLAGARATVCSEFVASVCGLELDPENTTPTDLRLYILTTQKYRRIV